MDVLTPFEALLQQAILFLPKIIAALVIFVISLLVAGLAQRGVQRALNVRRVERELSLVLGRISRWAVITLGLMTALEQVNFNVTSFLAGLGIMGVTLGFALQDISKNFVAGVLLLIQQPFEIGDSINVSGYEGTVLDVTVTYTALKTWDGLRVFIPNAAVYTDAITNYSALPYRRRSFTLRLGSAHDPAQATQIFLEAVQSVEGVAADPAPFINTNGLMAGHYAMQVFFHVDQTAHNLSTTHSEVVRAVRAAAQQHNLRVF